MLSRREIMLTPAALLALRTAAAADGKMTLALHQNTSSRAGFRPSLEGWARAGIKNVEITNNLLDGFLKTDSLAAAKRLLGDLGLTPVSGACGVGGLIEPNPERATALDNFKKRCEMFATLGLPRIYSTTATTMKPTPDDYKAAPAHVKEVGEIAAQFQLTAMFECVRTSTFASTLVTMLSITRAAGQPNDGVTPLAAILRKLAASGYAGALSVELLSAKFQDGDPYEVAREIKGKAESVMRSAGVL
jgi:sugar phosphate isomerase/epimerase